ncbi:MAG: NAD(P)(+) transhydrogenase (Re/Si-specific) subunit beta [Bacteroidia bacterium]|nr:NAD(P)(+) transhydrogenase (Re/Si-specific) subunit beta [Bacteroidia bacterium]MCZ2248471.1 NAD(P)(+) transhydrogenase (Re/Si-specific) subunit beta [Bacteroidia bacterium]
MTQNLLEICYLIGSITFIVGLKMMGNAKTARNGNLVAAAGMTLAIVGTLFLHDKKVSGIIYGLIFAAIAIGTVIGWLTAKKVQMTKMPELVSIFNGMGGACAALISLIEYNHLYTELQDPVYVAALALSGSAGSLIGTLAAIMAGLIIGTVSFSGSIIAFMKLNGSMAKPIRLPSYNIINTLVMIAVLAFGTYLVFTGGNITLVYLLFVAAAIYGILFTIPIGGADMPVVISLLNSFTGLAAAFGGFLYDNKIMLTGGILVGSAGTLLTLVMCKAMNRPLSNVIFGAFGGSSASDSTDTATKGSIKDINVTDLAILMNYSKKVVIVPGYGLAVAQAQHIIHELELLLEDRGVEVKYAIHPVAGRMPGHMNVLLAESNVAYEKLVEMDDINPEFEQTDVVLVVGANDVVNPAAKTDPSSPIYGMPILEVDKAKNIIVNKRSMNAGYAGIDNLLFYDSKCSMFFGDAKKALTELVAEIKTL